MSNHFFLEKVEDGRYRVALFDTHKIFSAENPGALATVFECDLKDRTREEDAQIFYAMAPSIGASDLCIDLRESHRSQRLNSWSIGTKDLNINNLFLAMKPLNREDRIALYSQQYSVTPEEDVTSKTNSLFSLVAFSEKQTWKTGLLQRCIDALVLSKYRGDPKVYSVIDEEYRRIQRFKLETEAIEILNQSDRALVLFLKKILSLLGLRNSHDTTVFPTIPEEVSKYLDMFQNMVPIYKKDGSIYERLSDLLYRWSGAKITKATNGFQLTVDPSVTEGLSYLQPWLPRPTTLTIIEENF